VLVEQEGPHLRALPLLSGTSHALDDVARFCRTGEGSLLLRVNDLGRLVRSARHDINNPLAAALVEVQLLLMDATDPEIRRALGSVQAQLRRIQDLVARFDLPGAARTPAPRP
jgi:signal transduction histidine kinase